MWTCETNPTPVVCFIFEQPNEVNFIRFWNYNRKDELERGTAYVKITADDTLVTPSFGILLRKAPGLDSVDYS